MDAHCRIELLGHLRALQGDREITRFRSQKYGGLLAYLAVHLRTPHAREYLIDLFWPDLEIDAGRNNLSTALSTLRHLLEPPGVPAGAVLIADRASIRLNPEAVRTDVQEFEGALATARSAPSLTEQTQELLHAVDLYRGELLPGFYEEWIEADRDRLADACVQALRKLVRHFAKTHDLPRAIDCARRAIGANPLVEELHRDLIQLYAASGQVSAGLAQYREVERICREELGSRPSAATRQLAQQLEARAAAAGESLAPAPAAEAPPAKAHPSPAVAPSARPTGTVTFLLTDIEGSTARWQEAGEAFKQTLADHHKLLRREFVRHGGYEVKEAGDSFLVAFTSAADGLACALAGQQALDRHTWPEAAGPVRVRMALYTGDVQIEEDEYRSLVLHHASRLLSVGHGGQILCSHATAELLRRSLDSGLQLLDLGVYRLRDMPGVERIFQAAFSGTAQREFPPLRAEAGYAGSLPLQMTRFFGREAETAQLEELLCPARLASPPRLVTLTGPGGTGKTRLALHSAVRLLDCYSGAVWFVPLARLADGALIPAAVAEALRLPRSPHVQPYDQVVQALSRQASLVVLDNCEHVVEAASELAERLLQDAPSVTILATSRQVLAAAGERELPLRPLPVPPPGEVAPERLTKCESVQLFVDRAQAVKPDFQLTASNAQAVAQLCDELEGIPLALELAAARAQVMTPQQMLSQLSNRLDFFQSRQRHAEARHRTLRAAVDWSYRLLSPQMQQFCARLSVFRGGWTAEAAEAVGEEPLALDLLAEARECSLVLAEETAGAMRFGMLETLRQYGIEQLSSEELAAARDRHAAYYALLAEEAEPHLKGFGQETWLARLDGEHDNLRAALDWFGVPGGDAEAGLRMAAALLWFWVIRGLLAEGNAYLARLLDAAGTAAAPIHRAAALNAFAWVRVNRAEFIDAMPAATGAREIYEAVGSDSGRAFALVALGWSTAQQGAMTQAAELADQSLEAAGAAGDTHLQATALNLQGLFAMWAHDFERATALFQQSLALHRERGDLRNTNTLTHNLGYIAQLAGDAVKAEAYCRQSLATAVALGDPEIQAQGLETLSWVALTRGKAERSARLLGAMERIRETIGMPVPPSDRPEHARLVDSIRAALGDEASATARKSGRAMREEDAFAYALSDTETG